MSKKKILMLVGDFVEDYEVMVPFGSGPVIFEIKLKEQPDRDNARPLQSSRRDLLAPAAGLESSPASCGAFDRSYRKSCPSRIDRPCI